MIISPAAQSRLGILKRAEAEWMAGPWQGNKKILFTDVQYWTEIKCPSEYRYCNADSEESVRPTD